MCFQHVLESCCVESVDGERLVLHALDDLVGCTHHQVVQVDAVYRVGQVTLQACHRHRGRERRLGETVEHLQCGGKVAEHLVSSRGRDHKARARCKEL